ncbi:Hypothetical predicted protein [Xyrichtys novacula]|uniref:Uncharacterized protein n=1 Tax=Xyrichtys novacula TaxID=13765 RepID=A0AAV1EXQ4_XYRNO|nr:Hypothetical predicted protein [Xyrichtys novacula]
MTFNVVRQVRGEDPDADTETEINLKRLLMSKKGEIVQTEEVRRAGWLAVVWAGDTAGKNQRRQELINMKIVTGSKVLKIIPRGRPGDTSVPLGRVDNTQALRLRAAGFLKSLNWR